MWTFWTSWATFSEVTTRGVRRESETQVWGDELGIARPLIKVERSGKEGVEAVEGKRKRDD